MSGLTSDPGGEWTGRDCGSVAFLDFEASSLLGYPIEVGFARIWKNGDIQSAARLIFVDAWDEAEDLWDPNAEAIHGITREQLHAEGRSAREVMEWLNDQFADVDEAYCDGGGHDQAWLRELTHEAGVQPDFFLRDIAIAFEHPDISEVRFEQAKKAFLNRKVLHRAEADARDLAHLFALSAGWPLTSLTFRDQD